MSKLDSRWEKGTDHHALAMQFREWLEYHKLDVELNWKFGGDGDEGETILMALSEFFQDVDTHVLVLPPGVGL